MNMVHVTKTPDDKYMIVDATGAPLEGAGFAKTMGVDMLAEVGAELKKYGFTNQANDKAMAGVDKTGCTILCF
jgi:hypothetical protein